MYPIVICTSPFYSFGTKNRPFYAGAPLFRKSQVKRVRISSIVILRFTAQYFYS